MGFFATNAACPPARTSGSLHLRSPVSPKPHTRATAMQGTGLRFYEPSLGRWMNRDPIGSPGRTLYAFLANNPTRLTDAEQGRSPAESLGSQPTAADPTSAQPWGRPEEAGVCGGEFAFENEKNRLYESVLHSAGCCKAKRIEYVDPVPPPAYQGKEEDKKYEQGVGKTEVPQSMYWVAHYHSYKLSGAGPGDDYDECEYQQVVVSCIRLSPATPGAPEGNWTRIIWDPDFKPGTRAPKDGGPSGTYDRWRSIDKGPFEEHRYAFVWITNPWPNDGAEHVGHPPYATLEVYGKTPDFHSLGSRGWFWSKTTCRP